MGTTRRSATGLVLASLLLFLACSIDEDIVRTDSGLVGTWEYSGTIAGRAVTVLWRFEANGNFIDNTLDGEEWSFFSGTYRIEDDRLMITLTDGDVSSFRFSVAEDRLDIVRLAIDNITLVFNRTQKTVQSP